MVVAAEVVVAVTRCTRRRPQEVYGRLPQEGKLMLAHAFKIHRRIQVGQVPDSLTIDQAAVSETFQADHQDIGGECRSTGIRRVAISHRAERKNLPQSLLGGGKPVNKLVRRGAQIADTTCLLYT